MRLKVERWVLVNAAVMAAAVAASVIFQRAAAAVPLAGLASLGFLITAAGRPSAADAVSGLRALGGAAAFIIAALGYYGGLLYIILLSAAETTDFFDGRIARKFGSSSIGGSLDMDTDAFFILLLSFSAFRFGGMGAWVLIPGLLRYVFVFVFMAIKPVPVESKPLSFFMKSACVAAVITLIAANAVFLPRFFRLAGAFTAASLLAVSFSWETVYYAAKRKA